MYHWMVWWLANGEMDWINVDDEIFNYVSAEANLTNTVFLNCDLSGAIFKNFEKRRFPFSLALHY